MATSINIDARRELIVAGDQAQTLDFATDHWLQLAQAAIEKRNRFVVALSGGSTPKAIYQRLSNPKNRDRLDWRCVYLFWSDERAVPADHDQSNYHMAMEVGNLKTLPIPKDQIFRMKAERDIERNALEYEKTIESVLKGAPFDCIMLGLGEDGHTASLFPKTAGLLAVNRKVIANFIPDKKSYRMSFTFEIINTSEQPVVYAIGESKQVILARVLKGSYDPDQFPSMRVGTKEHPALFIADELAAKLVNSA